MVFCPYCGEELKIKRSFTDLFMDVLQCPAESDHSFLEVLDPVYIFPLLPLNHGVADILEQADAEMVERVSDKIQTIDYKTVSILEFEKAIKKEFLKISTCPPMNTPQINEMTRASG